jgi:hypothetical protein
MLELTYDRPFQAEDFIESGKQILADNPDVNVNAPDIASCLDELAKLYRPVIAGDRYSIVHTASGELELWLNDALVGRACSETGPRAYFSIWLDAEHSIGNSFQRDLVKGLAAEAKFVPAGELYGQ